MANLLTAAYSSMHVQGFEEAARAVGWRTRKVLKQ